MKGHQHLKKLLALAAYLILAWPLLQRTLGFVEEEKLVGEFEPVPRPEWSWEAWFSGEFQEGTEAYRNENFGSRNTLIRLSNQYQWSVLGRASGRAALGQQGYLYTDAYIDAYMGRRNLGMTYNRTLAYELLKLQQDLEGLGTRMCVVLAPGKASFFPEYLPLNENMNPKGPSTYEHLDSLFRAMNVNYIDMDSWFRQMKDTSSYPLFPQGGVHWSDYGKFLAADSLTHYLENLTGQDLPELVLDGVTWSDFNLRKDYDIGETMNLYWRTPTYPMAYPRYHIERKPNQRPLKVLGIGDSYFLGLYNGGLMEEVFGDGEFWYYNKTIYPPRPNLPVVQDLEVWKELAGFEVVIVMATVANANEIGWGIGPQAQRNRWGLDKLNPEVYEEAIRQDPGWMKSIKEKAQAAGISVEEMIKADAMFMAQQAAKAAEQ